MNEPEIIKTTQLYWVDSLEQIKSTSIVLHWWQVPTWHTNSLFRFKITQSFCSVRCFKERRNISSWLIIRMYIVNTLGVPIIAVLG